MSLGTRDAALGRGYPGRRLTLIGDSIFAAGATAATNLLTPYYYYGFEWWLSFLTRQRFHVSIARNFGISGNTVQQTYDRRSNYLGATDTDIYILMIGTNDINTSFDFTTFKNIYKGLIQELVDTGKPVIVIPPLPRNLSINVRGSLFRAQRWICDHLNTYFPSVRVIKEVLYAYADQTSITGDPRTSPAAYSYDGLHPNALGAYAVAKPIAAYLNTFFDQPGIDYPLWNVADVYDAVLNPSGNMLSNGLMLTDSNVDGVADGTITATANAAGVTATHSLVAGLDNDGRKWQQVVFGGSYTYAAGALWRMQQSIAAANFSPGDIVDAYCAVEIDASPAIANVAGLFIRTRATMNGLAMVSEGGWPGTTLQDGPIMPGEVIRGVMRAPALTITAVPSTTVDYLAGVYFRGPGTLVPAGQLRLTATYMGKREL